MPIIVQFIMMHIHPFKHVFKNFPWQLTFYYSFFLGDDGFIIAITDM